ncbi:mycofactocin-coupled SDR family oxidoreductase [Gordonia sp. NPDC058843]|uniref:mycofactocin-coupled SDR family oxidoreductase n=1 Tax=Gordonia TaxID=2053 RepID=UPI0036A1127F
MGTLDGKVAFITGAARGQGRSHAIKLASEGADIIAIDLCSQISTVEYAMSTPDDLDITIKEVEAAGGKIVASQGDVRDPEAVSSALARGEETLGRRVDIVLANAGIMPLGVNVNTHEAFLDVIDVNLNGVHNTVEAAVPSLLENQGGSIVITSSSQGLKGTGGMGGVNAAYTAAKHGVVGLMRNYANWLGPQNIRVNTIHPTGVATPMIQNPIIEQFYSDPNADFDAVRNIMPVPFIDPIDVSNAIAFLVSDAGKYITGVTFPVDAGFNAR